MRERHPHLHNKFAREAYKRALAMYRGYRRILKKWKRLPEARRKRTRPPSPPRVGENRVVELHVDVYKLVRRNGFPALTISKGSGIYLKFLVMEYEHARRELEFAKLGNSKVVIDDDNMFLLLTIRRDVEVVEHGNKLAVDINEDSVDCLLIDYDNGKASFFSIRHDIRAIRTNYRRIRMRIQEKVENPILRNKLLAKYGARERNRVEDRLKKITTLLAEIARKHNADLVRETQRPKARQ